MILNHHGADEALSKGIGMHTSEKVDEIFSALSKAQKDFPAIGRDKDVKQKGVSKAGKDYEITYSYAPLERIIEAVRKPLSENNLAFFQSQPGAFILTRVVHSSGQWFQTEFPILSQGQHTMQDFGKISTYGRRYALQQSLGIQPDDEDEDTSTVQPARQTYQQRNPVKNTDQLYLTAKQSEELFNLAKSKGFTKDDVVATIKNLTGKEKLSEVPTVALPVIEGYFKNNSPEAR